MSSSWYSGQGPGFAPAYQVAGVPFVTSSVAQQANAVGEVLRISFPYVTKNIAIKNIGTVSLRVAFTKSGSYAAGQRDPDSGGALRPATYESNYFLIPPCSGGGSGEADAPPTIFDVRCKEIFFRSNSAGTDAEFSLYAALTGVEEFPVITGSNGFKGVG
tara:strand:+ start:8902 stop:9381 length:480 start_codon:yes stop_codon:yes gene_type:complete